MDEIGEELDVSRTTVRRWAQALRLRPRRRRLAPAVEDLVRADLVRMVREGLDDGAIAEELGLAVASVAAYRRRAGWLYRSGIAVDPKAVTRLFRRGLVDDEIAEALDISPVTVGKHRHRLGLLRGPARPTKQSREGTERPGPALRWPGPGLGD